MKLSDLVKQIKKSGLVPSIQEGYSHPVNVCSRWILLDSSVYGRHVFEGDFLVDVEKIVSWSRNQVENTWTNQVNVEDAKIYFAEWISRADLKNDLPTLLDRYQQEFLKPHISTFISMKCFKVYCPSCANFYQEVIESGEKGGGAGKKISWTDEYQCPKGHLLYSQEEEIRLF